MESFNNSISSSPSSRPASRRSKDHHSRPSPPPPSSAPRASDPTLSSPPSSDLKFRVSISHHDAQPSPTLAHSHSPRDGSDAKGCNLLKRPPGCEKFVSMQSLRERSDDTERILDSERDNSVRSFVGKRGRTDDHHSRGDISDKRSKSIMTDEKDVDGMVVSVATRKHASSDKKNGRNGDNRFSKGPSCMQTEPSASHTEDLQEAKSASKTLPMRDPGAQMDVDRVSPKDKKAVSVSRLPLKKAFKTLRALNEVGNSSDCIMKKSEHGSSSGGESTGAWKRVSPSNPCLGGEDNGEGAQANASPAECSARIQDFPIKFSHISKRARSHRERRSYEKVANTGAHQQDNDGKPEVASVANTSEGKPEVASKQEDFLTSKIGEDSDSRVQEDDGTGADVKEEEGKLEVKGTSESREVQLDPDGILDFEGDSKQQPASHEGAKASDKNFDVLENIDANVPVEMVAGVAIDERSPQPSGMEIPGVIHRVRSHEDGKKSDSVCDRKEHEMMQEAIGEQGCKTCSEVHSVDGAAVGASTAKEMHESSQRGLMLNFLDKGPVEKDNHANQISVHKGLDNSNQLTLSLFAKCAEAEGSKVKELTMMQDLEKENFLQRDPQLQACSVQNGIDDHGKVGDDHSSHGHGEQPFKLGSFQLSLALPGTSNAQAVSNTLNDKGPMAPAKSFQSPSRSHTQTHTQNFSRSQAQTQNFSQSQTGTYSDGFTDSFSQSSLRNPSCSVDCVSLDNQELSCGGSRQLSQANKNFSQRSRQTVSAKEWHGVVSLSQDRSNHRPGMPLYQWNLQNGSTHGFPSASGSNRICENNDASQRNCTSGQKFQVDSKILDLSTQELHEIATEPVAIMAQKMQELPDSFLEGLKGLAKDLLGSFSKREEFLTLQSIIKSRTDLTEHTLLHAQQTQLEIFVAFKTGLQDFVQEGAKPLTYKVLTEIFLQTRCRNTTCQQSLPVDGCECKICSEKKGFCHDCMCVVCTKFDSDNQTCRWVGCDLCMHWCHTDCGLRMSYVTSSRSSQGAAGTTEMQYQCVACGHHLKLFGFVKDVFHHCADSWGAETLTKELDCVRRIFHGSEDVRGKQLCRKVEEMLQKLEKEVDIAEIRRNILQYFSDVNAGQGTAASKQSMFTKTNEATNGRAVAAQEAATQVDRGVRNRLADEMPHVTLQSYERELHVDKINETGQVQVGKVRKRAEIESMVRMKQAEANMLQVRADEAHQAARGLQQIISVKQEKIEDDYVCKYAKLRLNEAEEKRRKRFMELQALERAQLDYERMKHKIEAQIQDLAIKMKMANWQYAQMT